MKPVVASFSLQKLSKPINPTCFCICCFPSGLLDRQTLRNCQKICRTWGRLAQETMAERKLRRGIEEQIKATLKVRGLQSITYLAMLKKLDKICSRVWLGPPPLFILFQKYTRTTVDPTYANFVEVPIPLKDAEVERCDQKVGPSLVSLRQPQTNSFLLNLYTGGHFQKCFCQNSHQAAANGGAKCVLWYIFHQSAAEEVSGPSGPNPRG